VSTNLREVVAWSAHEMCTRGLTWGRDAGDTSARDPDTGHIYILPKPGAKLEIPTWDVIKPEHVAVVDADGNKLEPAAPDPTVELLTHLRVYQHRSDVHAIVHSHGPWTRVFAALRRPLPAHMLDAFVYTGAAPITCAAFGIVGSDEVAMSVVACLGDYGKVALLAAHGAVCAGGSMEEALSVADIAEDMARLAHHVVVHGGAPEVTLGDLQDPSASRRELLRRYEL
jgi:ribulose-5-phosphate 4-epimerase/fuculose-1-phosphate aldolase